MVELDALAARLWLANESVAGACLRHPFVRGLASGSLAIASFRAYVAQDAYFLDAFARAYACALARSPDRQGVMAFQRLIAGVVEELGLHAAYAERWQVDLTRVEPMPPTLAYTDFLLATAAISDVGAICAAALGDTMTLSMPNSTEIVGSSTAGNTEDARISAATTMVIVPCEYSATTRHCRPVASTQVA